jgi:hypothetical protein
MAWLSIESSKLTVCIATGKFTSTGPKKRGYNFTTTVLEVEIEWINEPLKFLD